MAKKLAQHLSANALQLIINQLCGLIIFYILSTGLNKTDFGQINLVLAILLAVFNILSLGMDQLVIKKIASGHAVQHSLSLYICHVLISGSLFYGLLLAGKNIFPHQTNTCDLLLLIGIGKLMIYFSTPFKQAANGMERFKLLAYMSVTSNLVRCVSLLIFAALHTINMYTIIMIFITGDLAELLVCIYLFYHSTKTRIAVQWDKPGYFKLIRESLPQSGVVVITSALARFDWIFIGFTLSAIKLAEYSFAYKVFEIATLPMLTIAPLLIPRFTRLFKQGNTTTTNLQFLIRVEIIVAVLIALLLNVCWAPVVDGITAGKYGAVNIKTIFLLSLCMPLLYINNFLWTIYFAKGQLKMILTSFVITLFVNIAGDVILIPLYKNEGAAFAFLLACSAQTIFYLKKNDITELRQISASLATCIACALCSGLVIKYSILNTWIALSFSMILYFALLLLTGQVKLSDRRSLQLLLNW
jgi:O-antigen/teichoic acid export membrane protein